MTPITAPIFRSHTLPKTLHSIFYSPFSAAAGSRSGHPEARPAKREPRGLGFRVWSYAARGLRLDCEGCGLASSGGASGGVGGVSIGIIMKDYL